MRCDVCPRMKAIKTALEGCQSCDNGSHAGHSFVQATDFTLRQRVHDDHTQSEGGVTRLAPDDEDKLRKAIASLFSLTPIDLLYVQHIFNAKPSHKFDETLHEVLQQLRAYGSSRGKTVEQSRQTLIKRRKRIAAKFPAMAAVFAGAIDPYATPS